MSEDKKVSTFTMVHYKLSKHVMKIFFKDPKRAEVFVLYMRVVDSAAASKIWTVSIRHNFTMGCSYCENEGIQYSGDHAGGSYFEECSYFDESETRRVYDQFEYLFRLRILTEEGWSAEQLRKSILFQ